MNKLKHILGPWRYHMNKMGKRQISDKDGRRIGMLWSWSKEVVEANARLITAAPEMLDILIKCLKLLNKEIDCYAICEFNDNVIYLEVLKVIKKATGLTIEEVLKDE